MANIFSYYQAAILENMVQWWNLFTRHIWGIEQLDILFSLVDWLLNLPFSPPLKLTNGIVAVIYKVWNNLRGKLAQEQSAIASFTGHPKSRSNQGYFL